MNNNEILEQLKKIETDMLKEFISICEKLNLKYYLAYGTLIGAIRHKGFIPWDDDIDVVMPRKDYEIFLEKAQALLPEHLFLQHIGTEPEYMTPFAKIRNSNTTFMQKSDMKYNINHGVFIDIIPLDFCPDSEKEFEKIMAKKKRYDFRINSSFDYGTVKNRNTKIKIALYKLLYPSLKAVKIKREKLYKSVSETNQFTVYCFLKPWLNTAPVEWFGEGVEVDFEGLKAIVPKGYHEWNTQLYGDYMQLPPLSEQVPHHYTGIIDLTKSYKEYI